MRLSWDPATNLLRLTGATEATEHAQVASIPGLIDVGEGGRLIGIELHEQPGVDLATALAPWQRDPASAPYVSLDADTAYIELSVSDDAGGAAQVRSADATLRAELDAAGGLLALGIPRRGAGWEISWPSGNQ